MILRSETAALREILAGLNAALFFARESATGLELVYVNRALEELSGYSAEDLLTSGLPLLCPKRATLEEFQQFQNLACPASTTSVRMRCQHRDGKEYWVELVLQRQPGRVQGQAVHCVGLLRNVTTQNSAESALKSAIDEQQLILDSISSPVLGLTRDMEVKFCNQAYSSFVSTPMHDLVGRKLLDLFPSFKNNRSYKIYQQVLASGQPQTLEGGMGDSYLHIVVYPTPWGIMALAEDYTERRRFEDELINRDRLLLGFAQASALLASGARDKRLINLALAELGKSARVDHVYLLEFLPGQSNQLAIGNQRYEWNKESIEPPQDILIRQGFSLQDNLPRWHSSFLRGIPVYGLSQHFPQDERMLLEEHGILSALIVPVMIQRRLWGLIGFNDYTEPREWRQSEVGVLLAAAASVGSAIAHQDAEARLLHERSFLQQVIDSIPDLVFYKDLESIYMGCNAAFSRFAGREKSEIVGYSDVDLFPAAMTDMFFEGDRHALDSRSQCQEEEWVVYPDGRRVLLDTLKVPFTDNLGTIIGVLGVSRDITEKRRTEQVQREFVDNVSHELRTPITALVGLAETLQRSDLSEDQRAQLLRRLESQALRLARLADDILSLSNLELAQHSIRRDRVDLRTISQSAFDALQTIAVEKRLEYKLALAEQPVDTVGDAALLELLVSNLLSNAIRYTPPGGQVRLDVLAKPKQAIVEVVDTGIGIESEQQDRIFDRFYRVDKGRSRAEGGTGLGLAIVNQVLQLHNGEIKVISQPGTGSAFTAIFPRIQENPSLIHTQELA